MKKPLFVALALLTAVTAYMRGPGVLAATSPMNCDLSAYKAASGLSAATAGDALAVTWDGDRGQEIRLRFAIDSGTPTIQELAVRAKGAGWGTLATNATPEFRVVSGRRRMDREAEEGLRENGITEITPEVFEKNQWDPFWDAPLNIPGGMANDGRTVGLPRKPEEVHRGTATYQARSCQVKTDGTHLMVTFPGVTLGVFAGELRYTVYKGSNLIQQEVIAKTEQNSVAYKYDAGLKGLSIGEGSRIVWRDQTNAPQNYWFGGARNEREAPLKTANRLLIAERGKAGSIAAFPPPHNFFWARESDQNLGYNWYRKDPSTSLGAGPSTSLGAGPSTSLGAGPSTSLGAGPSTSLGAGPSTSLGAGPSTSLGAGPSTSLGAGPSTSLGTGPSTSLGTGPSTSLGTGGETFAFGIRQAEDEETPNIKGNFALYSARPGTLQHMPVFFYVSAEPAEQAREAVLAFTHGDHYKPIAGYKTMVHHYHMNFGRRLMAEGSADAEIVDLHALRALGLNIVSPVDNVGTGGGAGNQAPAQVLAQRQFEIDGAKRHSDKDFLVMPDQEFYGSVLGGHTDLLYSHPVYWLYGRASGKPLVEENAKYGKVYNIGSPDDLMAMVTREDVMMSMPHPRTKNNAGYPDGYKDKSFFKDAHFQGFGFRWGMGVDRSERRLCEYRCLPLLDDAGNWFANDPTPPKYIMAISEVQTQAPGDEIYSSAPVNYLKLDTLPPVDDTSPIIKTLMRGDYFVTSGEILIPSYSVQGTGASRKIVADVEWTFPLDFVEVVWGDGQRTDRTIVSTTDAAGFGRRHFEIPFDATARKWVRFAAWDIAGNGALVQPIKLAAPALTTK